MSPSSMNINGGGGWGDLEFRSKLQGDAGTKTEKRSFLARVLPGGLEDRLRARWVGQRQGMTGRTFISRGGKGVLVGGTVMCVFLRHFTRTLTSRGVTLRGGIESWV